MLQAKKAYELTSFHVKSLRVRNKEIQLLLLLFRRLTTVAALLAGFCATGLWVGNDPDTVFEAEQVVQGSILGKPSVKPFTISRLLLAVLLSGSLGSLLVCLSISTICSLWGPGLALRGHGTEEFHSAVAVMDLSFDGAFRFASARTTSLTAPQLPLPPYVCRWFVCGYSFFITASVVAPWSIFPFLPALLSSSVILCGVCRIAVDMSVAHSQFAPQQLTSGNIEGDPFKNQPPPATLHPQQLADFGLAIFP